MSTYEPKDDAERALVAEQTTRYGRSWNDAASSSRTPADSGRCPFEYEHDYSEPEATLATIENMELYAGVPGVFAYSRETGEEYSANPGDYWNASAGWTMTDSEGEPMILCKRVCEHVDIAEIVTVAR